MDCALAPLIPRKFAAPPTDAPTNLPTVGLDVYGARISEVWIPFNFVNNCITALKNKIIITKPIIICEYLTRLIQTTYVMR